MNAKQIDDEAAYGLSWGAPTWAASSLKEDEMPCIHIDGAILTVGGTYKPGDQPPHGYLDWHEWAEVQHNAGLEQRQCGRCGKWKFPQELSDITDVYTLMDRRGTRVPQEEPVCLDCKSRKEESWLSPQNK